MCGRISYYSEQSEVESFIETKLNIQFTPSYNICPTDRILILKEDRTVRIAKWGLIPSWSTDNKTILTNARAESIASKASFKEAFVERRCLVLANGFYEWKKENNKKIPHYITSSSLPLLMFAGVFNEGLEHSNVSIITREANDIMQSIHDRMPVIIDKAQWDNWLNKDKLEDSLELLSAPPCSLMIKEVCQELNNVRNKSSNCLACP